MGKEALLGEMIRKLQQLRQQLGRMPSRPEFHKETGYTVEQLLDACDGSGYQKLIELSGLKYSAVGKRDKQAIRKEVFEHLKKEVEQRRAIVSPPQLCRSVLAIGDLHVPYQHPDAIEWLIALNQKYKFDKIIGIGDEIDNHAISFHTHDPSLLSPGHELDAAIKALEPLYKEFPIVDTCESNHTSLFYRKQKHFGLPARVMKSYGEILSAPPGWKWHFEIDIQLSTGQRCLFHHSYGANILLASQRRGQNLVSGHIHSSFSVQHWSNSERTYFAAQTGCLVDDLSLSMSYNKGSVQRPIMGSLAILGGVPKLLPMFLDSRGRWNNKLP